MISKTEFQDLFVVEVGKQWLLSSESKICISHVSNNKIVIPEEIYSAKKIFKLFIG